MHRYRKTIGMSVLPCCLIGAAVALGIGQNAADAQISASATPVVVELFTSQGCSSCPPADALLERLSASPNIIAITRPVTYWDNLGWRDTLAREGNTQLQRAYATRGGAGAGVYTPQAMVQGVNGVTGSNEAAVRGYIAAAQARPAPAITVSPSADGGRTVVIAGTKTGQATVSVIALRSAVNVHIGQGENGGRSVRYTNVVTGEHVLASWTGGRATIAVPARFLREGGADRAAVIVQIIKAGPILAAHLL